MIYERFERRGPAGRILFGDLRRPSGPPPASAVVVAHGFKGFKDWGFFPHLCEGLADEGHAVISFNFSGNGVAGHGSDFTDLEGFAANTFSREVEELRWMVDAVRDGDIVPARPRKVGLLGHSRGGGVAVLAAAGLSPLAGLVTWAAVSTFWRWPEAELERWRQAGRTHVLNARTGQELPLDVTLLQDLESNREALDVAAAASRIRAPWLVVHGTDDATVAVDDARALAAATDTARLHLVDGAGHTFQAAHPFVGEPPELAEALEATRVHFRRLLEGVA